MGIKAQKSNIRISRQASVNLSRRHHAILCFSHPDYTVGAGISPARRLSAFADYTAGEEFHLALKQIMLLYFPFGKTHANYYIPPKRVCK